MLALLVNTAATLFGSGVAMRLRTMQAGPAMQVPVFLFLFIAPVWLPYDLLTGWVHAAATLQSGHALPRDRARVHRGDPTHVLLAFALGIGMVGAACCGRAEASAAPSAPPE